MRHLQHSSSGCDNCIRNNDLLTWTHEVEKCIQERLYDLVTHQDFRGTTVKPDPATCVSLERRAIEEINGCYRDKQNYMYEKPKLCKILGEDISNHTQQDLNHLVSAFRVGGEYHDSTVNSGIPELVRECGHSSVADSLYIGQPTYRLIFCMWAKNKERTNGSPLPVEKSHYSEFLSRNINDNQVNNINDNQVNFVYGGPNLNEDCKENVPYNTQADIGTQYHTVTWFASPSNSAARNWNKTGTAIIYDNGRTITGYFELTYDREEPLLNTIRDYTKCGDGVRQPGEVCDYAMLNSSACTFECDIRPAIDDDEPDYECSVDRLSPSHCWAQTCGDGKRTSSEACDDGNDINNDGCDRMCHVEQQFTCTHNYNQTSKCIRHPHTPIAQRQVTGSHIDLMEGTETVPPVGASVDSPLEVRGLSSGTSLNSRIESLLLTVTLVTIWTTLALQH